MPGGAEGALEAEKPEVVTAAWTTSGFPVVATAALTVHFPQARPLLSWESSQHPGRRAGSPLPGGREVQDQGASFRCLLGGCAWDRRVETASRQGMCGAWAGWGVQGGLRGSTRDGQPASSLALTPQGL